MPSQKVHDTVSLALASVFTAGGFLSMNPNLFCLAGGAAMGTLVHPDWDYAEIKGVVADLGPFKYLVKPYGILVPHRHWFSHTPIIGTAGRLLYIFVPLWILAQALVVVGIFTVNPIGQLASQPRSWWVALGLAVADFLHFVMDMWVTGTKRFLHQLLRGV